jgi:AraC-like DNA-binding protein
VLWARLQRAVREAGRGRSLTECAAAAGFSDGAHFSRTFRAHFGLSPSVVLPWIELDAPAWSPR